MLESMTILVASVIVVTAIAVTAVRRLWKPTLEAPLTPWQRIVLLVGGPFSLTIAALSVLLFAKSEAISSASTREIHAVVVDHQEDDGRVNLKVAESKSTYQIKSSTSRYFDLDRFVAEREPGRSYVLLVDEDMQRLANGEILPEDVGLLDRPDLVLVLLTNEEIVWVYEVRSEGATYLARDDADRARRRQDLWLPFFVVPVFLCGFAVSVICVAADR